MKHILITGVIGSGKTTLLHKLIEEMNLGRVPGLVTWNDRGKAVFMRLTGEDTAVLIGENRSEENRMQPVPDGFNVEGVSFLERLMNDPADWVMIDEIGFLEAGCAPYLEKLAELFEKKRVIASVRKQNIKHIRDIMQREDAQVIDLDLSDRMKQS